MNKINSEVYADISIIINMMPTEMKNRISSNFINFIERNKSNNYVSNINSKISLNNQKVRKETKEMLSIIYRDYLCEYGEQKKLLEEEKQELRNDEKQVIEKYNSNDLFKNVYGKK